MKVKIQQFLFGKLYSWAIVGQNIGRALLKLGHDVHFISTDGLNEKYIPEDLRPHIKQSLDKNYDIQISYTAPHNFSQYLKNGNKNRFAIYNYEYSGSNILSGFGKYHNFADKILPSSNFSKQVFLDMKMPEEKLKVIPHGINLEDFKNKNKYQLKTDKKIKILLNIASPHKRKAIPRALEVYGRAFNKNDDVCLVIKVHVNNVKEVKKVNSFDVDFYSIYKSFQKKYPNHAEIKVITDYIPNIVELYNACDIQFSTTHCECFHLPSCEALAAGLINVVPNYGGQLDFCNEKNSLLIDVDIVRAPKDHQYWLYSPYAQHSVIKLDDAVAKLKLAVNDYDNLKEKFLPEMEIVNKLTWDNVAKEILNYATKT